MNRWDLSVWIWLKNKTILYWFLSLSIVLLAQLLNIGRAVNTIDRKQSKTWERVYSPGLVNVWDLQHSLMPLSDSSGFNILPATMGAFFSSWKCTFPSRSHIYSFLKRSLLVAGLLSVWGASWVLWRRPPGMEQGYRDMDTRQLKGPPAFHHPPRALQSSLPPKTFHQLSGRHQPPLVKVLCVLKYILSRREGN